MADKFFGCSNLCDNVLIKCKCKYINERKGTNCILKSAFQENY